MLAAETEQEKAAAEMLPAEVAPPVPEPVAEAQISTEGAVPDVAANGVAIEPGKTASEQAFGDKPTKQTGEMNGGMYEPAEYKMACETAGVPEKWDDRYWHGHTEADGWTQPKNRFDHNQFNLKRGYSASESLKGFLKGPTIADLRVIAVATELDLLREELGDHKFDRMFGSAVAVEDNRIAPHQRLHMTIGMYGIPFRDQMEEIADAADEQENKAAEPEAPAAAAGLEQTNTTEAKGTAPSAELIADELGIEREQEEQIA